LYATSSRKRPDELGSIQKMLIGEEDELDAIQRILILVEAEAEAETDT
jgi:hypothetical protein